MANAAKTRIDALKAQQAELQARIAMAEEDRRKRTGRLAERAGLFDLDVDEDTLEREFSALAARLRDASAPPLPTSDGPTDVAAAIAARATGKGGRVASGT
jgi:TraC-like protein